MNFLTYLLGVDLFFKRGTIALNAALNTHGSWKCGLFKIEIPTKLESNTASTSRSQ